MSAPLSPKRRPRPIEQQGEERRRQIMVFLADFQAAHGKAPSLRAIADAVGLKQTHTVRMHLYRLRGDGLVDYFPRQGTPARLTSAGLKQLGRAA